ncbi:hypothetical protein WA026_003153 [Henosepilachna vigintioctopunctata]|uniref:G-protein coupled receptors family 2 profile 2 domain-containing protein n=1 Tax=Henosepilachna vigintioctopunctata TaxID=420089 RepID=A0AAW1TH64_9CUCU
MSVLLAFLLIFNIELSTGSNFHYPKCCNSEEMVKENNSIYGCVENRNLRLQIHSQEKNLFNNFENGFCVDIIENHFALFESDNETLKHKTNLSVFQYPKCCPLNYYYDPNFHSCSKSYENNFTTPSGVHFLRIGLPKCDLIADYRVESSEVFLDENNALFVPEPNKTYSSGKYCYDENENGTHYIRVCENSYEICDRVRCIHKCCMDGQSFVNGAKCEDTYVHGISLNFTERIEYPYDNFAVIHGHNCILYQLSETKFAYHLDPQGIFHMYEDIADQTKSYNIHDQAYCVEHVDKKPTIFQYMFFRCFPQVVSIKVKFLFTRWAMLASCICLVLTIVAYTITSEIRTFFGKILISYCAALLLGFACLSYLSFDLYSKDLVCRIMGTLGFYLIFSSFTWLNIMCFDIYYTFSSSSPLENKRCSKKWRRFIYYSIYAWGLPLVLSLVCELYLNHVSPMYSTKLIRTNCIFQKSDKDAYADLIFSTIPLTVLEISNVIFFVKTVRYYLNVKVQVMKVNEGKIYGQDVKNRLEKYKERLMSFRLLCSLKQSCIDDTLL